MTIYFGAFHYTPTGNLPEELKLKDKQLTNHPGSELRKLIVHLQPISSKSVKRRLLSTSQLIAITPWQSHTAFNNQIYKLQSKPAVNNT